MSSKKESTLQAFAALLGILASGVALQDWYGKRTAGAEPFSASASMGVFRLHSSGTGAEEPAAPPAAEPVADTPAPEQAASALPPAATPSAPPAVAQRVPGPAAPVTTGSAPPAATPPPSAPPAAPAASTGPFAALASASADARSGVAAAVRGEGASRLLSGLEQHGMGAVRGGFAQSPHFDQMLGGDVSALRRSGALGGGRVLVGELQASYDEAAMGVVGCVLTFSYVVLNARGSRVARRTVAVDVTGNDRASALSEAVTELLKVHGATIAGDAGG